jgi:hypothetical protein
MARKLITMGAPRVSRSMPTRRCGAASSDE